MRNVQPIDMCNKCQFKDKEKRIRGKGIFQDLPLLIPLLSRCALTIIRSRIGLDGVFCKLHWAKRKELTYMHAPSHPPPLHKLS